MKNTEYELDLLIKNQPLECVVGEHPWVIVKRSNDQGYYKYSRCPNCLTWKKERSE